MDLGKLTAEEKACIAVLGRAATVSNDSGDTHLSRKEMISDVEFDLIKDYVRRNFKPVAQDESITIENIISCLECDTPLEYLVQRIKNIQLLNSLYHETEIIAQSMGLTNSESAYLKEVNKRLISGRLTGIYKWAVFFGILMLFIVFFLFFQFK